MFRLAEGHRDDHGPFVESVLRLLKSHYLLLMERIEGADRSVKRWYYALAVESAEADIPALLTKALHERDAVQRLWAARQARGYSESLYFSR